MTDGTCDDCGDHVPPSAPLFTDHEDGRLVHLCSDCYGS